MRPKLLVDPWLVVYTATAPGGGMAVGARMLPVANRTTQGLYIPGRDVVPQDLVPYALRMAKDKLPDELQDNVVIRAATKMTGMSIIEGSDGRKYRLTIAIDRAD